MSWITRAIAAEESRLEEPTATAESLADEFIESYVCWREACEDVRGAYERWTRCEPAERGLGFGGYRAALDREEHAARIHCSCTEQLRAVEWRHGSAQERH
jgi:hypothetical protein